MSFLITVMASGIINPSYSLFEFFFPTMNLWQIGSLHGKGFIHGATVFNVKGEEGVGKQGKGHAKV